MCREYLSVFFIGIADPLSAPPQGGGWSLLTMRRILLRLINRLGYMTSGRMFGSKVQEV
jgi:hypothetical protein